MFYGDITYEFGIRSNLYAINRYAMVGVTTASYFELVLFTYGYDTYAPMVQIAVCGGVGVYLLYNTRARTRRQCVHSMLMRVYWPCKLVLPVAYLTYRHRPYSQADAFSTCNFHDYYGLIVLLVELDELHVSIDLGYIYYKFS